MFINSAEYSATGNGPVLSSLMIAPWMMIRPFGARHSADLRTISVA